MRAVPDASGVAKRWLLFVHQLPSKPSNIRVRVWRRLQQIGALVIKQAVYVLPDSSEAREDFEWLKTEIEGVGGQASILSADHIDGAADEALVEEFRRARQEDYASLAREIESSLGVARAAGTRRGRGRRLEHRPVHALRERLAAIERIDFFASAGRDRVVALIEQVASRQAPARGDTRPSGGTGAHTTYRARVWVTRPRPGVDRMASAWLIRRFIDARPRFAFHPPGEVPRNGIPFDMAGCELGHQGEDCTFETLLKRFGLRGDPALAAIAQIVHDVDLKDGKFGRPEGAGVNAVLRGFEARIADDQKLLREALGVFDGLYEALAAGPRSGGSGRRRRRA